MTQNAFNNINKQSYQYQYQDIRYIGEKLIQTSSIQDNSRRNIKLIPPLGVGTDEGGVPIDVYGILGAFENDLNNGTKLVGVFNTGGNHWIAYTLYKDDEAIKYIYKNSLGAICSDLANAITTKFHGARILNIDSNKEQILEFEPLVNGIHNHVNCGIFALKNMLILAQTDVSDFTQNTNNVSFFTPGVDEDNYVNTIMTSREEFGKIFLQYQIEELRNTQIRRLVSDHHKPEAEELKKLIHLACTVEIATIPSNPKMYQYKIKLSDDNNLQDIVNRLDSLGITFETTNSDNIILLCNTDILCNHVDLESLQKLINDNRTFNPDTNFDYTLLFSNLVKECNISSTEDQKLAKQILNNIYGVDLGGFLVTEDEKKNDSVSSKIDEETNLNIPVLQTNDNAPGIVTIKSKTKSIETLSEFLARNPHYDQYLQKINESFNLRATLISNSKILIKDYDVKKLKTCAGFLKENQSLFDNEKTYIETLAMIRRAAELAYGFQIRDTQIIALIAFIKKDSEELKGVIEQILTGEGKTITIAMLASLKHLETGKKIDIATSSTELAKRDANDEKSQKFYGSLGITVTHNIDKQLDCYKKDIVYGVNSTFEGDWLREYYKGENILHKRKSEDSILIVDEVDNMFVDNKASVTLLAEEFVGSNKIKIVFRVIWHLLLSLDKTQSDSAKITNKEDTSNAHQYMVKIDGIDESINISSYLRRTVEQVLDNSNFLLGKPITVYAKLRLDTWINSAIKAQYSYKKGREYIIENEAVKPVDYSNTGEIQGNTHYSDGIHQFLELKEGVELTNENRVTNFISNIGFYKSYSKIYGMTGTIGTEYEEEFLKSTYKVVAEYIPSQYDRQLSIIHPTGSANENTFDQNLKTKIMNVVNDGRPVLVINQDINTTKQIWEFLKQSFPNKNVMLCCDDETKHDESRKLVPSEIIVSTNLSGRGSDFKIDEEIEKRGGLHVIVTFIPENQRVQDQAFGRAGRKGQKGSAELFVDIEKELSKLKQSYSDEVYNAFESIGVNRKKLENLESNKDDVLKALLKFYEAKSRTVLAGADEELKYITCRDYLFSKFKTLLIEKIGNNDQYYSNKTKLDNRKEIYKSINDNNELKKTLEMEWVNFLDQNIESIKKGLVTQTKESEAAIKFKEWRKEVRESIKSDTFVKRVELLYQKIVDEIKENKKEKFSKTLGIAKKIDEKDSAILSYLRGMSYCQESNIDREKALKHLNKASALVDHEAQIFFAMRNLPTVRTTVSDIDVMLGGLNVIKTFINESRFLLLDKQVGFDILERISGTFNSTGDNYNQRSIYGLFKELSKNDKTKHAYEKYWQKTYGTETKVDWFENVKNKIDRIKSEYETLTKKSDGFLITNDSDNETKKEKKTITTEITEVIEELRVYYSINMLDGLRLNEQEKLLKGALNRVISDLKKTKSIVNGVGQPLKGENKTIYNDGIEISIRSVNISKKFSSDEAVIKYFEDQGLVEVIFLKEVSSLWTKTALVAMSLGTMALGIGLCFIPGGGAFALPLIVQASFSAYDAVKAIVFEEFEGWRANLTKAGLGLTLGIATAGLFTSIPAVPFFAFNKDMPQVVAKVMYAAAPRTFVQLSSYQGAVLGSALLVRLFGWKIGFYEGNDDLLKIIQNTSKFQDRLSDMGRDISARINDAQQLEEEIIKKAQSGINNVIIEIGKITEQLRDEYDKLQIRVSAKKEESKGQFKELSKEKIGKIEVEIAELEDEATSKKQEFHEAKNLYNAGMNYMTSQVFNTKDDQTSEERPQSPVLKIDDSEEITVNNVETNGTKFFHILLSNKTPGERIKPQIRQINEIEGWRDKEIASIQNQLKQEMLLLERIQKHNTNFVAERNNTEYSYSKDDMRNIISIIQGKFCQQNSKFEYINLTELKDKSYANDTVALCNYNGYWTLAFSKGSGEYGIINNELNIVNYDRENKKYEDYIFKGNGMSENAIITIDKLYNRDKTCYAKEEVHQIRSYFIKEFLLHYYKSVESIVKGNAIVNVLLQKDEVKQQIEFLKNHIKEETSLESVFSIYDKREQQQRESNGSIISKDVDIVITERHLWVNYDKEHITNQNLVSVISSLGFKEEKTESNRMVFSKIHNFILDEYDKNFVKTELNQEATKPLLIDEMLKDYGLHPSELKDFLLNQQSEQINKQQKEYIKKTFTFYDSEVTSAGLIGMLRAKEIENMENIINYFPRLQMRMEEKNTNYYDEMITSCQLRDGEFDIIVNALKHHLRDNPSTLKKWMDNLRKVASNKIGLKTNEIQVVRLENNLSGFNFLPNEIIERDSTDHYNMGNDLFETNKEDSLACYNRAISLKRNFHEAHNNKGSILSDLHRKEEALESFDIAIDLNPNEVLYHCNKGKILVDLGKDEDALNCFDRAYEISRSGNLGSNLSIDNVNYINNTLLTDRVELLLKIKELQASSIKTQADLEQLDKNDVIVKKAAEKFKKLLSEKSKIIDQAIDVFDAKKGLQDHHSNELLLDRMNEMQNMIMRMKAEIVGLKDRVATQEIVIANHGDEIGEINIKLNILESISKSIEEKMFGSNLSEAQQKIINESIRELKDSMRIIASRIDSNDPILEEVTSRLTELSRNQDFNKKAFLTIVIRISEMKEQIESHEEFIEQSRDSIGTTIDIRIASIKYDNDLLNNWDLFKELFKKVGLSNILNISTCLDHGLISEAIETRDHDIILAGLLSLDYSLVI